jgi:hypothetical protein
MRTWPALILAPLLALGSISLAYALVTPACERGMVWVLHAVILGSFILALAATALAWTGKDEFLRLVATWCGAFFSLVIAIQWLAQFVVTPCMH